MSKILRQNVSGIDYTMAGCSITGTCASAEASFTKIISLLDADAIYDGMLLAVKFTSGNSAGTAPNYITLYSSDQITYYSDAELTQPYSLAPEGCYELEYTGTGNAYDYISFPVLSVGGITGPIANGVGSLIAQSIWNAGETGLFLYTDGKFMLMKTAAGGDLTVDKLIVRKALEVDDTASFGHDVSIAGDLNVNGAARINDSETVQTSDDYLVLRHNKTTALGANEHAGIAVHNYMPNKTATCTVDNHGTWRVADNTETSTTYIDVSYYNGSYYAGLSDTATTVGSGIKSAWDVDELSECALYNGVYYHFDGTSYFEIVLVNNELTLGAVATDQNVIDALDATTHYDLVYFRSLTVTVINEVENEPLLTRDEASNLVDGHVLKWDAAAQKAVDGGTGGVGGLAFVGTRAQYNTAKLIPDGQPGHIPAGAMVKITDENEYVKGDEQNE